MTRTRAYAKLNLALVVGPLRPDGKHEVATVLQAVDLHDDVGVEPAGDLVVEGFEEDTLVRAALEAMSARAGVAAGWHARIEKRIPVASGLGGGSSDAAASLRLADALLSEPLGPEALHDVAVGVGADVPFFLRTGPQLATGDGTELASVALPTDYVALIVVADDARKESTGAVYRSFDERDGPAGFSVRRTSLTDALERVETPVDLAALPGNDLASSPLSEELRRLGAFRADVTGAGPAVYGLFESEPVARRAAASLRRMGPKWLARPVSGGASPRG